MSYFQDTQRKGLYRECTPWGGARNLWSHFRILPTISPAGGGAKGHGLTPIIVLGSRNKEKHRAGGEPSPNKPNRDDWKLWHPEGSRWPKGRSAQAGPHHWCGRTAVPWWKPIPVPSRGSPGMVRVEEPE